MSYQFSADHHATLIDSLPSGIESGRVVTASPDLLWCNLWHVFGGVNDADIAFGSDSLVVDGLNLHIVLCVVVIVLLEVDDSLADISLWLEDLSGPFRVTGLSSQAIVNFVVDSGCVLFHWRQGVPSDDQIANLSATTGDSCWCCERLIMKRVVRWRW